MEELSFSIDDKYQINLVYHSSETRMLTLTNQQARRFILLKQGLIGEYRFTGKSGILDFIKQADAYNLIRSMSAVRIRNLFCNQG